MGDKHSNRDSKAQGAYDPYTGSRILKSPKNTSNHGGPEYYDINLDSGRGATMGARYTEKATTHEG